MFECRTPNLKDGMPVTIYIKRKMVTVIVAGGGQREMMVWEVTDGGNESERLQREFKEERERQSCFDF